MYVAVTMAQALTRDGFDLRQHRFSWLTTGDLGWIHQSNMVLVGVLTVLLAVGVRQMLRTGRGAVWGPRLLGLFACFAFCPRRGVRRDWQPREGQPTSAAAPATLIAEPAFVGLRRLG